VIDTHSHLLPGLDHGCPDLETSLRMVRSAWEAGTTTIVCTPHLYDWDPLLLDRAREVRAKVEAALCEEDVGVRLLLGFEVDLSVIAEADADMIARLAIDGSGSAAGATPTSGSTTQSAPVSSLGSKGVIVIETPFHGWPPFLQETLFRLRTSGYTPILAHPERNERLQRSPELLDDCIRAGAVAQGTAGSLAGPFRKGSMRTFLDLLARGSLSLLASDGHAQVDYTWSLAPLIEELRKRAPEDYLQTLVGLNPERVLAGRQPLPGFPDSRQGGKSWWKR
jgi:protein-tyrosine phosphatase